MEIVTLGMQEEDWGLSTSEGEFHNVAVYETVSQKSWQKAQLPRRWGKLEKITKVYIREIASEYSEKGNFIPQSQDSSPCVAIVRDMTKVCGMRWEEKKE